MSIVMRNLVQVFVYNFVSKLGEIDFLKMYLVKRSIFKIYLQNSLFGVYERYEKCRNSADKCRKRLFLQINFKHSLFTKSDFLNDLFY